MPFSARVNLGAMVMIAFPIASALLEPYHQMVLCHTRTLILGVVLPLCSWFILQPQPAEKMGWRHMKLVDLTV